MNREEISTTYRDFIIKYDTEKENWYIDLINKDKWSRYELSDVTAPKLSSIKIIIDDIIDSKDIKNPQNKSVFVLVKNYRYTNVIYKEGIYLGSTNKRHFVKLPDSGLIESADLNIIFFYDKENKQELEEQLKNFVDKANKLERLEDDVIDLKESLDLDFLNLTTSYNK